MKNFYELSEREILALAISLKQEDERVYADFSLCKLTTDPKQDLRPHAPACHVPSWRGNSADSDFR
jgi:hypothetical protein